MANEKSPDDAAIASGISPSSPPPPAFRRVFIGPNGIRAGWRFLIYVILFGSFVFVFQKALKPFPAIRNTVRMAQKEGILTPGAQFILEGIGICATFLAAFIMARIEKRSFANYGFPFRQAFGRLFWEGALWGLAFESLTILGIVALGGFSLGTLALSGSALVSYAVLWAIGFLLVGIQEEFTFRGYTQATLASGIGFWPAAIAVSVLFGAVHLGNQGEGWTGAVSVMLFGIFACFTLRRTGNLWFAIGFHAAADYAETFIYSTPDSGLLAKGHLLNSSFHGSKWVTGGSIGPEGSLVCFGVFLLAFILFAWRYPAKNTGPGQFSPAMS